MDCGEKKSNEVNNLNSSAMETDGGLEGRKIEPKKENVEVDPLGDVDPAEQAEDTQNKAKEKSDESAAEATTEAAASSEENAEETSEPAKSTIKCVLCDIVLSRADRPMLLECLHSACSACIDAKLQEQPDQDQEVVDSNAVLCPWCSITSNRTNLIVDRFVLEACPNGLQAGSGIEDEAAETSICVSCDENIVASSFCEDCAEFLCDTCVQAHRRVRVTKDHSIVEKSQAGQRHRSGTSSGHDTSVVELRCTTHPAESLSLFCEKCDRLTCRDCQLTEHREHKFKFVNEIAADARRSLNALLNEVTYKRGLLESAVKVIDKRQSAIDEKKQQVVQEITKLVITLTNAINTRGKQLVQRLGEVCDNKQRTLVDKRATLQQLTRLTDHCINAVNSQLQNGSDLALLWSKKTIMRHLQRIKCRRADIPNPDIPVRIHFAQQRVETLCNALATVGGIVVDGRAYPHAETSDRSTRSPGLLSSTPQQTPPTPAAQQQQSPATHPPQQQMPQGQQQHAVQHHGHISLAHQAGSAQTVHHRPTQQHMQQQQHHPQSMVRPVGNSHQVSSSTHPGVHQLRNLLSPGSKGMGVAPSIRIVPGPQLPMLRPLLPPPPQQQQQQQHHMGSQIRVQGVRLPMHRPPPPLTPATSMSSMAQSRAPVWHIPPERAAVHGGQSTTPNQQAPNENFRITLTHQWLPASEQVSSTGNQRSTPSPASASNTKTASEATIHMDSFAQKSMDELFSTIATISNPSKGNSAPETSTASLVDSSTGSPSQRLFKAGVPESPVKDDPNDDWCAVCMDGGDLVCCDRCPKVFHTHCHIPQLGSIEETPDSWQCLLCTPVTEILQTPVPAYEDGGQKLNPRQLRTAQRLLLELYCQFDHSQPFREPVSVEMFPDYPRVVQHPMSLDIIKRRLELGHPESYIDIQHFVNDVRQIFKNAYAFNPRGTPVFNEAQALEDVFEGMLSKWLPSYASTTRLYNTTHGPSSASVPVDPQDDAAQKRKKPRLE